MLHSALPLGRIKPTLRSTSVLTPAPSRWTSSISWQPPRLPTFPLIMSGQSLLRAAPFSSSTRIKHYYDSTLHSSPTGLVMRCTTLNREGNVTTTSGSFTKGLSPCSCTSRSIDDDVDSMDRLIAALCLKYGIQPRDLRKIDSRVPSVVPTILARKSCILVS